MLAAAVTKIAIAVVTNLVLSGDLQGEDQHPGLGPLILIREANMFLSCERRDLTLGLLLIFLVGMVAISVEAQDDSTPKADIFVGYQWLNPGGSIPVPGTANPVQGQQLPSLSKGFGLAFGYNFYRSFAMEADFGRNWDHDLS
ncbi:MAG: hypothetical protein ACM34G_05855, partial [Acidobacteriota bacterium]